MLSVGDAFNLSLFFINRKMNLCTVLSSKSFQIIMWQRAKKYESDIFKNATILRYPVYDIWTLFAKLIKI